MKIKGYNYWDLVKIETLINIFFFDDKKNKY